MCQEKLKLTQISSHACDLNSAIACNDSNTVRRAVGNVDDEFTSIIELLAKSRYESRPNSITPFT